MTFTHFCKSHLAFLLLWHYIAHFVFSHFTFSNFCSSHFELPLFSASVQLISYFHIQRPCTSHFAFPHSHFYTSHFAFSHSHFYTSHFAFPHSHFYTSHFAFSKFARHISHFPHFAFRITKHPLVTQHIYHSINSDFTGSYSQRLQLIFCY
ncbi:hypothetical protein D3C75_1098940 [compost metagenome]